VRTLPAVLAAASSEEKGITMAKVKLSKKARQRMAMETVTLAIAQGWLAELRAAMKEEKIELLEAAADRIREIQEEDGEPKSPARKKLN
jgi:hypothetical protein